MSLLVRIRIHKRAHHIVIEDDDCTAQGGSWITIQGTHICIMQGESPEQAFKRTTGKDLEPGQPKGEEPKDLSAGKTLGKGGGKTMETPAGKQLSAVLAAWQKNDLSPPPNIGNGIETLTFAEFAAKFPDAKITRIGEFGLEAEVEGVDRHGVKFKDLYTAYASRKR